MQSQRINLVRNTIEIQTIREAKKMLGMKEKNFFEQNKVSGKI